MSGKKKWQNSGHIGGEFPELFNRDKTYPEGTEVRTTQGLGPVSNKKGAAHSSLCFPGVGNMHSLLPTALQTVTPCSPSQWCGSATSKSNTKQPFPQGDSSVIFPYSHEKSAEFGHCIS